VRKLWDFETPENYKEAREAIDSKLLLVIGFGV
jgi:hypothetical protein